MNHTRPLTSDPPRWSSPPGLVDRADDPESAQRMKSAKIIAREKRPTVTFRVTTLHAKKIHP